MAYTAVVAETAQPIVSSTLNAAFAGVGVTGEAVLQLLRRVVLAESVAG